MEKLVEAGLTRSIGISNFSVKKIEVHLGAHESVNTCLMVFIETHQEQFGLTRNCGSRCS